jgi:hypothetical protein
LDETLLGVDEYYEINRIIFESIIDSDNNIMNSIGSGLNIMFKTDGTVQYLDSFPDNIDVLDLPNEIIECSIPVVYMFYTKKIFDLRYPLKKGLYLDGSTNCGGGTVSYKIKIYYKIKQYGS